VAQTSGSKDSQIAHNGHQMIVRSEELDASPDVARFLRCFLDCMHSRITSETEPLSDLFQGCDCFRFLAISLYETTLSLPKEYVVAKCKDSCFSSKLVELMRSWFFPSFPFSLLARVGCSRSDGVCRALYAGLPHGASRKMRNGIF
jgi:hypothetical protein